MKVFLLVTCFMLSLIVDISDSRPESFPFHKSECSSGVGVTMTVVVMTEVVMVAMIKEETIETIRGGRNVSRRGRDNDGNDDRRDGNDDRRDGNDNNGGVRGNIYFSQKVDRDCTPTSELKVRVRLKGVNGDGDNNRDGRDRGDNGGKDDNDGRRRRFHGLHVHQFGDLRKQCLAAGPHYNPLGKDHGDRRGNPRHLGDLGNVRTDRRGNIKENFRVEQTSLVEIVGRAVVLHSGRDDLGRGGNAESRLNGNSGRRLACCVIGYAESRKRY
ncbi:hypothetical protein LOTGIDRAFT_166129 [Lottia gigantea]|uniref:Superoxide dismutase [Cu-Zn] n=1 Tax=Lottia gigantea TaxID=225164 RepID=V3ZA58_LOTGI|nr:hypothetical protein LOTGIDRAFT_166129 [Lottia gigantea]ESO87833.1 hypothetical protein LOTGIDRAFT_166129 [Lottia gigantea]